MVSQPLNIRGFKGLNLNSDPRYINEEDLVVAENVMLDDAATLSNRNGIKIAAYGETDAITHVVADTGLQRSYYAGTLKSYTGDRYIYLASGSRANPVANSTFLYPWRVLSEDIPIGLITQPTTNNAHKIGIPPGATYRVGSTNYLWWSSGIRISDLGSVSTWTVPAGTSNASIILAHKDRMFLSGKRRDSSYSARLFFSMEGDPTTWTSPSGGYFDVGVYESSDIIGLVSLQDRILIFKEESIWILYTNGTPSNWVLRALENRFGAFERTIVEYKGIIYFQNQSGVYRTDGGRPEKISGAIESMFNPRNFVSQSVSSDPETFFDSAITSAAIFDDKYYLLLLDKDENKRLMVYSIQFDSWTEWVPANPFIEYLADIFAIDVETDRDDTSEGPGLYFLYKNNYFEGPIIYKAVGLNSGVPGENIDTFLYYRDYVSIADTLNVGGTIGLWPGDVEDYTIRFTSGALTGTERTLVSATDISCVLSSALPSAPATNDKFIFYKKTPYPIQIKTKAFDLAQPGQFKKLRKANVSVKGNEFIVTTISGTYSSDLSDHIEVGSRTVTLETATNQIDTTICGSVRGQNFQFVIDVASCETSGFKLYGLTLYPVYKGELESNESLDSSS